MAENLDDETYAAPKGGEILTVTNMIALAGAVLLTGTVLEMFAGMDPAYAVGRIASVPLFVMAIVVGARRRRWPTLILPTVALAAVAATFFIGG